MKFQSKVIVLLFLIVATSLYAQKEKVIGFWKVESVSVGNRSKTPVAKWMKINSDKSYESGNGWLQNSKGQWSYDNKTKTYKTVDPLNVADEFGSFLVSFDKENMIWKRNEDGMEVKVILIPITEKPMSPADYFKGMWQQTSVSNPKAERRYNKLLIRWDRIYENYDEKGNKETGFWHIHGHRSEVTFIPHNLKQNREKWKISTNEKELKMIGISDNNKGITIDYKRKNTF